MATTSPNHSLLHSILEWDRFKQTMDLALACVLPIGAPPEQHRDVCRIYFMGYFEGLRQQQPMRASALMHHPYIIESAKPDWTPSKEWKWWDENQDKERQENQDTTSDKNATS